MAQSDRCDSACREALRLKHAKSDRRYRPTACRFDMRVTGEDNLWPSNMRPSGLDANRGDSGSPSMEQHRGAVVTPIRRIAFIGNSLPRRCGIATFTTDLQQAISNSHSGPETCIVAMTDHGQAYDYPSSVVLQIRDDSLEDYLRAADFLNAGRFDTVCLQHEFGIYGGEAGAHILVLLLRLTMPVVTTFHTVLAEPTVAQRAVMVRIAEASSKVVVMAKKGRELLRR